MALLRTHPVRVRSRHREQPVWEIRGAWPAPAKVSGQVTSSGAGSGQLCTPALGWTPRSAGVTRRHTRQRSDLCGCYDGVAVPMISRPDFTSGSSRQMAQLGDDVLSARRPALFGRRVDGERTVRARGLPRRSDARSHLAVGFSPSGVPTPQGDVVSISPIGARGVIVSSASGRDARCMLCTFC